MGEWPNKDFWVGLTSENKCDSPNKSGNRSGSCKSFPKGAQKNRSHKRRSDRSMEFGMGLIEGFKAPERVGRKDPNNCGDCRNPHGCLEVVFIPSFFDQGSVDVINGNCSDCINQGIHCGHQSGDHCSNQEGKDRRGRNNGSHPRKDFIGRCFRWENIRPCPGDSPANPSGIADHNGRERQQEQSVESGCLATLLHRTARHESHQ